MGNHFRWPISDDPETPTSLLLFLTVLSSFSRLKTFHSVKFFNLLKYYFIFVGKKGIHFRWPDPDSPPSLTSLPLFLTVLSHFSRLKSFHSSLFSNILKYYQIFTGKKANLFQCPNPHFPETPNSLPQLFKVLTHFSRPHEIHSGFFKIFPESKPFRAEKRRVYFDGPF